MTILDFQWALVAELPRNGSPVEYSCRYPVLEYTKFTPDRCVCVPICHTINLVAGCLCVHTEY